MEKPKELVGLSKIALMADVCRQTVYSWIERGVLSPVTGKKVTLQHRWRGRRLVSSREWWEAFDKKVNGEE